MRAVVVTEYGGPEVLTVRELPEPQPGPGEVSIDVASATLRLPDGGAVEFPLQAFARYCLLNGTDQLGFLLSREREIAAYEQDARP